jgi:hypothetical protein
VPNPNPAERLALLMEVAEAAEAWREAHDKAGGFDMTTQWDNLYAKEEAVFAALDACRAAGIRFNKEEGE